MKLSFVRNLLFIFFFCVPLFLFAQENIYFKVKIVGIKDGDTILGNIDSINNITIRLEGIDSPEMKQPFGNKAKEYLSLLTLNKNLLYSPTGRDKYGRVLANLFTQDTLSINLLLVQNGLAWHYKEYSSDTLLANTEKRAKNLKINLWSESNPIPPWEYRHGSVSRESQFKK